MGHKIAEVEVLEGSRKIGNGQKAGHWDDGGVDSGGRHGNKIGKPQEQVSGILGRDGNCDAVSQCWKEEA